MMTQTIQQQEKRTSSFVRDDNSVPKDWIPIQEAGLREPSREDRDTFSMRMNNEQYLYDLWRTFAGLVPVTKNGETYLKKASHLQPLMSFQGASELIGFIKSQTTSAVSLSKTHDDEMKSVFENLMRSIRRELTINKDKYNISNAQRMMVYSEIESYLFHQLKRAVNGHEASNIITQIQEQRGEHSVTETTEKKKRSWLGGNKR